MEDHRRTSESVTVVHLPSAICLGQEAVPEQAPAGELLTALLHLVAGALDRRSVRGSETASSGLSDRRGLVSWKQAGLAKKTLPVFLRNGGQISWCSVST